MGRHQANTPMEAVHSCPKGMATATFSRGTDADPEEQFQGMPQAEDTEDSQEWPDPDMVA